MTFNEYREQYENLETINLEDVLLAWEEEVLELKGIIFRNCDPVTRADDDDAERINEIHNEMDN